MMKPFCTVSIAVVFISLFIHPPNVFPAEGNPQEVIAVALRNWPPQFLTDEKTGRPAGFAIDIMNKVAELTDLKVRYVVYDNWPDAFEALRNNQAILAPNLGITDERLPLYDFTTPYETFRISIFVRRATVDINELGDLAGRKVAVVEKNQGLVLMRERGGSDLRIFNSTEEAFMALLSGSVDALVCPEQLIKGIAMQSGLEGKIKIIGKPLQEIKRGIAIRKGKPELFLKLDNAVGQFIKTPEFRRIYQKWYGKPESFWNVTRVIMVMGIVLGLTIAGMLAWRYFSILKLNRSLSETVTELKKAEDALRHSEAKYLDLYENAPDMYVSVDAATGTILECNQTLVQASGYSREEILGRPVFEMYHPDSLEGAKAAFQSFVATGEVWDIELQLRRKDGSKMDVSLNASSVRDEAGHILFGRSSWRDITARKHAEEALRKSESMLNAIFQASPLGIGLVSKDREMQWHNKTVSRMLGYSSNELQGKNTRMLYLNDAEFERVGKAINSLGPRKTTSDMETRWVRKDGSAFDCHIRHALLDPESKGRTILAMVEDITERKKAEEEKKKLEAQLNQAQKMEAIGVLAGGVAHDFNNILTSIIGNAELAMLDLDENSPINQSLDEIRKSGHRAASLTRQLLAFSRKEVIRLEVLDLNSVTMNMEKMLRRLIGEDIDLVTVYTPDPWKVEADPGQMEQVIMNLAVNARDAMLKGGKLTIETANVELDEGYFRDHGVKNQAGPYVVLAITDSGTGMDKETQARIFEPFFTTKEMGRGTGLGLSTVYGIVKQNKGHIWVYSEPERGTTFKMYLPRADADVEAAKTKSSFVPSLEGSETILVVEDDEMLGKMAEKILEGYGYRVITARTGKEALEISDNQDLPIHLMLTDVVMPGMSGRDLVEQLKPRVPGMKVVYMSGYTNNAIAHHGVLEKDVEFIQKPFTQEGLATRVREVLDKKPH